MKRLLFLTLFFPFVLAAAPVANDCYHLRDKSCCFVLYEWNPGDITQCDGWPCPKANTVTVNDPVAACSDCEAGEVGCNDECYAADPQPHIAPRCEGIEYTCTTPGNCDPLVRSAPCTVDDEHGDPCVVSVDPAD